MKRWLRGVHVVAALAELSLNNAKAETSYTTLSYYPTDTCDASAHRLDVGSFSCSDECTRQTSDWRSVQGYCDIVGYSSVVDQAFGGAAYILIEAFNDSDCKTVVDATAFQASGSCSQVIMYVDYWGFATYAIAKEEGGSVSIRYYNDSTCSLPLLESVTLLDGIDTQDVDIDQATLNSASCDENNLRRTYSAALSSGAPR